MKILKELVTGGGRTVGMSVAKYVPKGTEGTWKTGPLTICSAITAEVHQNGSHIGTLIAHQGNDDSSVLRRSISTEFAESSIFAFTGIKLKNIVVQTAPDTDVVDEGTNTTVALAKALEGLVNQDEVLKLAEQGPGIDVLSNEMTADIKADGSFSVPKRKGMFEKCTIM